MTKRGKSNLLRERRGRREPGLVGRGLGRRRPRGRGVYGGGGGIYARSPAAKGDGQGRAADETTQQVVVRAVGGDDADADDGRDGHEQRPRSRRVTHSYGASPGHDMSSQPAFVRQSEGRDIRACAAVVQPRSGSPHLASFRNLGPVSGKGGGQGGLSCFRPPHTPARETHTTGRCPSGHVRGRRGVMAGPALWHCGPAGSRAQHSAFFGFLIYPSRRNGRIVEESWKATHGPSMPEIRRTKRDIRPCLVQL